MWRAFRLTMIGGPFIPPGQAGSDGATGRLPYFGVAWYRKHLSIPATDAGKRIFLDLDGAMSYATVWCNGQIVGGWPDGYASWRLDLTPLINSTSNLRKSSWSSMIATLVLPFKT